MSFLRPSSLFHVWRSPLKGAGEAGVGFRGFSRGSRAHTPGPWPPTSDRGGSCLGCHSPPTQCTPRLASSVQPQTKPRCARPHPKSPAEFPRGRGTLGAGQGSGTLPPHAARAGSRLPPPRSAVTGAAAPPLGPQLSPRSRFPVERRHPGPGLSPEISRLNLNCSHTLMRPPPLAVPSPTPPPLRGRRPGAGSARGWLDPCRLGGWGLRGYLPDARENCPGVPPRKGRPWGLHGERGGTDSDREKAWLCASRHTPTRVHRTALRTRRCLPIRRPFWRHKTPPRRASVPPALLPLLREPGGGTGVSLFSHRGTPNVKAAALRIHGCFRFGALNTQCQGLPGAHAQQKPSPGVHLPL